jgi:GIY-YIG catalytic domain.
MKIKPFEEYPKVTTTLDKLRYSKGGIYFLYNPSGLQYVGQSENIAQRVKYHPATRGSDRNLWIVVVVKITSRRWRFYWEKRLIQHYTPLMNRQCNPAYMIVDHHTYVLRSSSND